MTHSIEISDQTYRRLLALSRSFEDTPERVIVRLLDGSDESTESEGLRDSKESLRGKVTRVSRGSILPELAYWPVILEVLAEAGGQAEANAVVEAVGERLKSDLKQPDLERVRSGEIRWRNRVRFARQRMKERGLLKSDSPRGIWEITDDGYEYLARVRSAAR